MRPNESEPPQTDEAGGGSEAEEAAWEIATGETLRGRGELAEAANWYRRAAQHLMEAGEDERAIEVAKLAAELAALDDAGRPSQLRVNVPAPAPAAPPPVPAGARKGGAAGERLPWAVRQPGDPPTGKPPMPEPARLPRPAASSTQASASAPFAALTQEAIPPRASSAAPSPLAAMVDEAVSHLEELPPAPLSGAPERTASRRPLSFMPQRLVESDQIAARLPALPLFAELPPARLRQVARQVGIVRYKSGELLCEAGGPEGPMFVIVEGSAWVGVGGDDAPASIVGTGDFVGEIAAMFGGSRTASVLAQGNVEAVAFAPSLVRALAREFPSFRETVEETVRERVAEFLPRSAPLLRRIDAGARAQAFKRFELLSVAEDCVLLSEGDPTDVMYLVAAGEVEIYGGELGPSLSRRARVGDAFGLTAVATGEPSGVSARPSRAALVARLDRAAWHDLTSAHPALLDAIADVGSPGRGVLC